MAKVVTQRMNKLGKKRSSLIATTQTTPQYDQRKPV